MSWLSLCLDSADRQISGGNACDGIRASAAIAPICQSREQAGWPSLQIMSVLVSSPLLPFSSKSHSPVAHNERHYVRQQKSGAFPILHLQWCYIARWETCSQCVMFSIRSEVLRVLVFRQLCSTHCHHNESIIICTIFQSLRQTQISGDWMSGLVRVAHLSLLSKSSGVTLMRQQFFSVLVWCLWINVLPFR